MSYLHPTVSSSRALAPFISPVVPVSVAKTSSGLSTCPNPSATSVACNASAHAALQAPEPSQTYSQTPLSQKPQETALIASPCVEPKAYSRSFLRGALSPVTNIFANKANLFTAAGLTTAGLGLMKLNKPLAEKLAAPLGWGVGAVQVLLGAKAYLSARNEKEMCEAMEGVGLAASGLALAALPSLMKGLENKMGQNKGLGPMASMATLLVLVDPLLDLLSLNTLLSKKKSTEVTASPSTTASLNASA